ncbi:3',5'-cyclic-AMP phosphodiesterase [Marinimicrobium sp. ABcell2]|uniref:3',5'-cyclic-AMP phosphodiesterase n=1 Tax=Marinimicrobium sp. ABcell2 TaxID=3069751 RepID=UPI0027B72B37|nr:3',5'-cyclic-AMP phosphodiesterase [Marinimicrobium sp. ABcell2]MDQ2076451.1 3',5'-cyclic-AMP phosphodiesterase [Marinimicrobium sp. ABcell2]
MNLSQPPTNERTVRLIQITDSHLGPDSNDMLLGLNTDQSLIDVLQLIADEQPAFDALVCTGDIASDSHAACYGRFLDCVRSFFAAPMGWLPGNHDSAELMARLEHKYLPESRLMNLGAWQLVLLDSSVPGETYGDLAEAELTFLENTLKAHPDQPTMIALHHQPIAVGSEWIDQYILRNADAFFALIERHPQVKAVTWGHVHQAFHSERNGVQLYATPATSVQFKPNSDSFAVDFTMPGYRWFDLHPDGTLESGISRVTGKTYDIDFQSAGY